MSEKLIIPPRGTLDVSVKYTPNEMDFQDSCEITFESANLGNWKFLLFGMGEPPTAYDELVMMGA